ncbi:MAG: sugar phosphate isomerase/epimerase family protein [Candidatus Jordarchaeum sp.]|uniref:sugar phosphate isomerase/epimerase family protein n=1 Tax=Candidatus Jordarchaeum sp. TaxID=2823881 RepID=UPI00404ACCF2
MSAIGFSSTLFLNLTLEEIIEKSAEYGYNSIEIWADLPQKWSGNFDEKEQYKIAEIIESHGFQSSIHAPIWDINIASHITNFRNESVNQIKWTMDLAQNLGSKLITLHPGHIPPYPFIPSLREKGKKNFLDSLQKLIEYSVETGVLIGLENIPISLSFCYTLEDLVEYIGRFDNLNVTLDIAHAYIVLKFFEFLDSKRVSISPESRIADTIKKLDKRLINIHLHDNDGSYDAHKIPGEGKIYFNPIMKVLKEINYNGLIALEIWGSKDPSNAALQAKKAIEKLLKR